MAECDGGFGGIGAVALYMIKPPEGVIIRFRSPRLSIRI
jgi:hypothetical protein